MRLARRTALLATAAILVAMVAAPSASAEDKRELLVVYFSGGSTRLEVRSPTGAPIRTLIDHPSNNLAFPSWSPDESTVAYFENGQIRRRPAAGGAETPIGAGGQPAFSPVSNEIAYLSWTSPTRTVRVIGSNGLNDREVAGSSNQYDPEPPAWSANGKTIAFARGGAILSVPASGGGPVSTIASPAAGRALSRPAFSPDGTRIAYLSTSTGPPAPVVPPDQLIVRDLATGAEHVIVDHPSGYVRLGILSSPSWSADSDRIAFVEDDFTQSTSSPTYRLSTIKSDGTGRNPIMTQNEFINFVSWANAPRPPSYFIKHVEIAQAISPNLGPLTPVDPLTTGTIAVPWGEPAVSGFALPLIAKKSTLLRIYTGDGSLGAGQTARRRVAYRISGGTLGSPIEREDDVDVSAPDVAPAQTSATGALNVWLPATAAASGSPVTFEVEVNRDEKDTECAGCYPNGNRAAVQGVSFQDGGEVILQLVDMLLVEKDGTIIKPKGYTSSTWGAMDSMVPVRDGGVRLAKNTSTALLRVDDLKTGIVGWYNDDYACSVLLAKLELERLVSGPVPGFGAVRWVGISSPFGLPGVKVECGGLANGIPGQSFIMTQPASDTAVHELGHTLGLSHTLGYGDSVPAGASALPYIGIGGVGYDRAGLLLGRVYDQLHFGDIMSYSPERWTSPRSWQGMFDAIRAESPPAAAGSGARASARRRNPAGKLARRRLVTGLIAPGRGVFLDSLVADALAPSRAGKVVGRVVAFDRAGHRMAAAAARRAGTGEVDHPPFVVSLPASKRIASLALMPAKGGKPLARLRRSKHAPAARFLALRRRAPARRALTVRWAARDRDGGKLTVVLQARRGKARWKTIAIGPAKGRASVKPRTLGGGRSLAVRMTVSDGFNTNVVARRISLKG